MITLLAIIDTLCGLYVVWCIVNFLQNRAAARKSGLPYFCFPLSDSKNWYILNSFGTIGRLIDRLPESVVHYVYTSSHMARLKARYKGVHAKVGDVCLMVSPGLMTCLVADAKAAEQIFANRTKFVKPSWNFDHLKLFGNNIVACDEQEWKYHRRFTGPPFNERNNALVWKEAISQSNDMVRQWTGGERNKATEDYQQLNKPGPEKFLKTTREDFRHLALHVISYAGFGVKMPFSGYFDKSGNRPEEGRDASLFGHKPPEGYYRNFGDNLAYIASYLVFVVALFSAVPQMVLKYSPFASLREPVEVTHDIEKFVSALIGMARSEQEEKAPTKVDRSGNLLTSIVISGKQHEDSGKPGSFFTDREIMGNVFIVAIAGHETTASTLQFALVMLALHQEQQEWLLKKLDEELAGQSNNPEEWDYTDVYEKLVSGRCLMFEILRLFPPLPGVVKWAAESQPLTLSDGTTYQLPEKLWITVNCGALHYHPKYWGPTANEFNPSRWDASNKDSFLRALQDPKKAGERNLEAPGLYRHVPGSWCPFSDGARACLGRKFAMVEFVGAFAVALRRHRVSLALKKGETMDDARKRAEKALFEASGLTALLMNEDVGLVLSER